jgi:hypothetical protein
MLEVGLDQIDSGSLNAKDLSERFLGQPDLLHWRSHLAAQLST